jgi:DNA-binding XRE family transcriptional regulator
VLSHVKKNVDSLTPAQSRAARALLKINQMTLAKSAGLGLSTVVDFEKERRQVSEEAVVAIKDALERAGAMFIETNGGGEGVRLRKPSRSRATNR